MLAASHAIGVTAYIDEKVATWLAGFPLAQSGASGGALRHDA